MEKFILLNPENAIKEEVENWPTRSSARAVVFDDNGQIPLLHVQQHHYFKLPGGGVDEGETIEDALIRECLEEIGCNIIIEHHLGIIEEYRKIFTLHQISHCFLAKIIGNKGLPAFTDFEQEKDFSLIWCSLDEAQNLLSTCKPNDKEGREYIVPRDLAILSKAKEMLEAD
tara:strand:- start:793 stop:1305 length:513 start_codon:yes stop_codon:yes gene_type:complete